MHDRALAPGAIGSLLLPHRIVMGAMHLGFESRDDGGRALAAFYAERVRGGAGLIVTGGAAVSPVGAGGPHYGVLDDPAFQERLGRVVDAVHAEGGLVALQLFHAGRYALVESVGLVPVAPSPVYSRIARCEPVELDGAGITATIDEFARGAARAAELDFDGVEVMGSEGYLIDQFLSPLTNRRDDEWGGDPARRQRFGVAVLAGVRAAVGPHFPVIVRFSGADLMPGGTDPAEVADFARSLADGGADALNVGVGWHESPVPTVQAIVPPGVWAPVAGAIKLAVGATAVIASNRVHRLELAEAVLAAGQADFVSMARPFLADPAIVDKSRHGAVVNVCIGCNQACIDRSLADVDVSCLVNPRAGREAEPGIAPALAPARLAVLGGGPAGMEAARTLASAGHRVWLYEADDELGGQFRLARRVPGKRDYGATVEYFAAELARLGVTVLLGRPVGAGDLTELRSYDGLVVATGARPRPVDIPGVDLPHVLAYPEAFAVGALGPRVAVIGGGGIGVDVAHLASHGASPLDAPARFRREQGIEPGDVPVSGGRSVTILQRGTRTGAGIGRTTRWAVLAELRRSGVEVVSGVTYHRITADGVEVSTGEGPRLVVADTVVVAAGQERDDSVAELARRSGRPYRVVGGARDVAGLDAVRAFAEGLDGAIGLGEELARRPTPGTAGVSAPAAAGRRYDRRRAMGESTST